MRLSFAKVKRLLRDPQAHARVVHGIDIPDLQVQLINTAERLIDAHSGGFACLRATRQFGKNEMAGFLHMRTAVRYYHRGGEYIRAAPTWRPQNVRSIMRLEKYLQPPCLLPHHAWRYGYMLQAGRFNMSFLSADKNANVVGGTASLALDIDEAHEVDEAKFENDFMPMTAKQNAPVLLWGVAATKRDILYKYRMKNIEEGFPERNVDITASMVSEIDPIYAAHYEDRIRKLGAKHPVVMMNYDLIDIDSFGGLLSPQQIKRILDSAHQRMKKPGTGRELYVAVIDIAGENEDGELDGPEQQTARQDSTVAWLVRVNTKRMKNDWPECHVVAGAWWTGKPMGADPSGMPGQQENLLHILKAWKPSRVVVDARGIGAQIAAYLKRRYPNVEPYAATADTVDDDVNSLLGMVNNNQLHMWRNDDSEIYNELVRQLQHTAYRVSPAGKLSIQKPKGDSTAHIDMVKALTYIPRALKKLYLVRAGNAPVANPL